MVDGTNEIRLNAEYTRPVDDNKNNLGKSTVRYKDLYLAGKLSDGTNELTINDIKNGYLPLTGGTLKGYLQTPTLKVTGNITDGNYAVTVAELYKVKNLPSAIIANPNSDPAETLNKIKIGDVTYSVGGGGGGTTGDYLPLTGGTLSGALICGNGSYIQLNNHALYTSKNSSRGEIIQRNIRKNNTQLDAFDINADSCSLMIRSTINTETLAVDDPYITMSRGNLNISIHGDLVPSKANNNETKLFKLGYKAAPWNELYVSGKISDGTNEVTVAEIKNGLSVARSSSVTTGNDGTEDYIKVGETKITETQLQQLLALLNK